MTTTSIGRESVLAALRERAPRAMHLMEIVAALRVGKQQRDDVLDVLDELTGLGMATEMPGNRFRLSKRRPRGGPDAPPEARAPQPGTEVMGWMTLHPRGFAFVAAEDGGGDVFIPPSALNGAMHRDRVRVNARPSPKGREGEVVEVLRRGTSRIAGVLHQQRRNAWLECDDPRVPDRVEVVGTIPLNIKPGDEVVAVIESWPQRDGDPLEARVLSALGVRGSAAVEIEKIKIREGVEEEFPDEVLAEAQTLGTRVPDAEIARREDLRGYELCTIDPPTARDHDDAVWAERIGDGGYRVIVAIADVSHYVRPGTALDEAALERGTSIYLPDRVIPMLPHELSSNLASLVPDEDRLCLAVEVELGPRGAIRSHRFIEGVMRSRARISYEGAARALGLTEEPARQPEAESRVELLKTLFDAATALRTKRMRRGSLDMDLPEAVVELDDTGEPVDIRRSRRDPGMKKAYGMIEDLMLLANEVVAADLSRRQLPAIYRVHGPPDEQRIETFAALAESLGHPLDAEGASDPKKLAAFLRSVEGSPRAQSLSYLLLRAMQQATYSPKNIGHFALAARNYLHFTSPIRRYPDLAVHRVVRAVIHHERVKKGALAERLAVQAAASSRLERRALTVDREATDLYRAIYMKERVGESFDATISHVADHGIYVTLDEPFVDARVPIATLGDDWYELDSLGLKLVGSRSGHSYGLGDRVQVRIDSVSIQEREITASVEAQLDADGVRERPRPRDRGDRRGSGGRGRDARASRKAGQKPGQKPGQKRSPKRSEKRGEETRGKRRGDKRTERDLSDTTPRKTRRSKSKSRSKGR